MIDTPLGPFDDHWMYCQACNVIRNGIQQITKFTDVMILPKEPIQLYPGPESMMLPITQDYRGIFWR